MTTDNDPTKACEQILERGINYNNQHRILPSENAIAKRLLERSTEMASVYSELQAKLSGSPQALETILGILLSVATFWNPDESKKIRRIRKQIEETNEKISHCASELAELLEVRSKFENSSGLSSNTHYHIINVIEDSSVNNGLFNGWVKKELRFLANRFDLKYWPSLSDIMGTLSKDATKAEILATDALTGAFTTRIRSSKADFFKALFEAIKQNHQTNHGWLPANFELTDDSLATIANSALDLDPEEIIDSSYVKRLRQRERERID